MKANKNKDPNPPKVWLEPGMMMHVFNPQHSGNIGRQSFESLRPASLISENLSKRKKVQIESIECLVKARHSSMDTN